MSNDALYQQLHAALDADREPLARLARNLHAEPELAFGEHKAAAWIAELLAAHGADVEIPFGGLDTAFRARLGEGAPHVAILAEYDALPDIGHACGHNLIAGAAVGAWLAVFAARDAIGVGTVDLIGTPAEEGGGGKIRLLEAGAFEGVDAAMMFHPFDRDLLMHHTLATEWIQLRFIGKPAHAAMAPEEGRSALTACMDTFRLIDGQRLHLPEGSRVHGYIVHGGDAVNIIPERAECQFSVRARTAAELVGVGDVVKRCAQGAAMASGVEVEVHARQGYLDMRNNEALAMRFGAHLESLGREPIVRDPDLGAGSTDMGDVSHHVPSIHPWLAICDKGESMCHEHAFAACAASDRGIDTMIVAAETMARTTIDILADDDFRQTVVAEFEGRGGLIRS
jgi:amidohydrolase